MEKNFCRNVVVIVAFQKKNGGGKTNKKTTSRERVYIYMNVPEMSYSIESSFVEALFLLCVETSLLGKIIFFCGGERRAVSCEYLKGKTWRI